LNISTKNNKTDLKILAITKNSHDIVLLCDIRLNSIKQSAAVHDIEKKFKLKGYDFIHNSKSSSRGVGILIKSSLPYIVHNKCADFNDNYLLLDLSLNDFRVIIGSVYGPNRDENEFFDNLKLDLRNLKQKNVLVGGDWNATWDSNPVPLNIDVVNMVNVPSRKRSLQIKAIANSLNLTDPYRFFHPEKRDFTFIPNILNNRNRSRLDFFLLTENLLQDCKNNIIPHSLSSKLFDHKQISISFKMNSNKNIQKIKDVILTDETFEKILLIHAFDTYINHASTGDGFTLAEKERLTAEIGRIMGIINSIQNEKILGAQTGNFLEHNAIIENLKIELQEGLERLPDLEFFENLALDCEDDVFFEILVIILKNASLSFQSNFYKTKNTQKNRIR
jgi:exonuclease III